MNYIVKIMKGEKSMYKPSEMLSGKLRKLIFCNTEQEITDMLTEIGIKSDDETRIRFLYYFLDLIENNSYGKIDNDEGLQKEPYSVAVVHFIYACKSERNKYEKQI